jgi:hypothetical protein
MTDRLSLLEIALLLLTGLPMLYTLGWWMTKVEQKYRGWAAARRVLAVDVPLWALWIAVFVWCWTN